MEDLMSDSLWRQALYYYEERGKIKRIRYPRSRKNNATGRG